MKAKQIIYELERGKFMPVSELKAIEEAVRFRIRMEYRKAELTPGYDVETGKKH